MKLIKKRSVIKKTPERWYQTYASGAGWDSSFWESGKTKRRVYEELLELDLGSCLEKDVNNIIGNDSWTRMNCDECGDDVDALVVLGQEPDYDSSTASICPKCLQEAIKCIA